MAASRCTIDPMSGHGFHVHGPHDHELEHTRQQGAHRNASTGAIAVTTAILATVGALFSYMGGATQANAGLYKNNAAIKKTEAANQWNFYQAKSGKQNLAELAIVLAPEDKRGAYKTEVERYKLEKAEIKLAAEKLEIEATDWDRRSDAQLHVHHRWAQATTALQVAIALAAIALLTGRRAFEWGMYGLAALGAALGAAATFHF
jgi:hypothetical protein